MKRTHPEAQSEYEVFLRKLLLVALAAALALSVCLLIWFASGILLLVFASVLVAIFVRGMSTRLTAAAKIPDFLSVIAVILALGGASFLASYLLAPHVGAQITELGRKLPNAFQQLQEELQGSVIGRQLLSHVPKLQDFTGGGELLREASGLFSVTFGLVFDLFILFFISLYFSFDPDSYREGLLQLVPPGKRARARAIFDALSVTLHRWLMGRLLGMAVVGVLTGAGLRLIGIPLALTLGLLAAALTFVPYLGAVMSVIPAVLLALLDHPVKALYVVGLYLGIHTLEAYFITPLVQQRQVLLPPVMIVVAQILLGYFLGLAGLMLATPLTAAAVVLVKMLYIEDILGEEADVPGSGGKGNQYPR